MVQSAGRWCASLLQGATGNSSDLQPYLQALGAATAATNVYAVSAYAPITNLDAADMGLLKVEL